MKQGYGTLSRVPPKTYPPCFDQEHDTLSGMSSRQSSNSRTESRAHHFVPQCWLAGFTDTGEKEGLLWVTDLKRGKQFRCKPSEVGHRRDFNRINNPGLSDPLAIEKLFSKIESKIAPLFKALFIEKRGPQNGFELGMLVEYMAIQSIRGPSFRHFLKNSANAFIENEVLKNPRAWRKALKRAKIPEDDPAADHAKLVELVSSGEIAFSPETAFYIQQGAFQLSEIGASLMKKKWSWFISESGQFIGCDSPVAVDGPQGKRIGFANADVVIYPVNRHLLLFGTRESVTPPSLTTKLIAHHNTFTMLTADEQVYSHRFDFHWLSSANKCLNDWKLFSKADFSGQHA